MAAPATSKRRSGNRRAFLVFLTLGGISAGGWLLAQAQTASFTFAAAGDHGTGPNAAAVFEQIGPSGASFFLSLGDLIYSHTYGEAKWCEFVKSRLGPRSGSFPVLIIAGAHQDAANHRVGLVGPAIGA